MKNKAVFMLSLASLMFFISYSAYASCKCSRVAVKSYPCRVYSCERICNRCTFGGPACPTCWACINARSCGCHGCRTCAYTPYYDLPPYGY